MVTHPVIAKEIFELRPDFTALSVYVSGIQNRASDDRCRRMLESACDEVGNVDWAEGHLNAWRDAYRGFGAKPKKTPCSAEALIKRANKGQALPAVNAVVDLYNALSVRYAIPVGGEDAVAYQGSPNLVITSGGEAFYTMSEGAPKSEILEAGEVVWRDNVGVTCRRWNWRQGVRTRIETESTDMWFVFERLDPMPIEALLQAGQDLISGLLQLGSNQKIDQRLFSASSPEGKQAL